jgi:hypothetical protein
MALPLDEDKQQVRPWPRHVVVADMLQLYTVVCPQRGF